MLTKDELKQIQIIDIETDKQAMAVIYTRENVITKYIDEVKVEQEKIMREKIQPLKNQIKELEGLYNQASSKVLKYLKSQNKSKVYAPVINRMAYIKTTGRVIVDDVDLIPLEYIKKTARKKDIKDSGKKIEGTHIEKHESVVVCVSGKEGEK